VRHIADRRYIGQPKADVLAELIRQRNPDAHIQTFHDRIENKMEVLDGLDLLVVGVDGEQVKYIINQACLERNIPAVYAGVYERGEGGDVALIRPHNGPCYACWAAELREGIHVSHDDAGELDYGMIGDEGTLEAEPALWLHVVRVATAQADIALRYLLGTADQLPANTVVLANNDLEIIEGTITPTYGAVWVDIQRDPDCLVCGDKLNAEAEEMSLHDLAGSIGIDIQDDENAENTLRKG
jgi:molybdopterin/thiamine biosynthesis adenylyltransferase